jgi:hypothetical protein
VPNKVCIYKLYYNYSFIDWSLNCTDGFSSTFLRLDFGGDEAVSSSNSMSAGALEAADTSSDLFLTFTFFALTIVLLKAGGKYINTAVLKNVI